MGLVWIVQCEYLDYPEAYIEQRVCTTEDGMKKSVRHWLSTPHRTKVTVLYYDSPTRVEEYSSDVS